MARRQVPVPESYRVLAQLVSDVLADGGHIPCVGSDPEMWHTEARENSVKVLCFGCPAQVECMSHAVICDEQGVWGGTTRLERLQLRALARAAVTADA